MNPRTFPLLLGIALAATVALPAATALELASQGTSAANAVYGGGADLGTITPCCRTTSYGGAHGETRAQTSWSADADLDEQAVIDEATDAQARAEAEVRGAVDDATDAAMELKDSVHTDVDWDVEARGEAGMESRAGGDAYLGVDGLIGARGGHQLKAPEVRARAEDVQAKADAKVEVAEDGAIDLLAQLLGQVQGQLTMGFDAACGAVVDAGASLGEALGLVQNADLDLGADANVAGSLGGVGQIQVPQVRAPDLALGGAADAAASAEGAASGIIH